MGRKNKQALFQKYEKVYQSYKKEILEIQKNITEILIYMED